MVHFRSTATFFATALSVAQLALGDSSTFTVLTGTSSDACSTDKVTMVQTRLGEAITLAKAASTALLNVKGVENSPAFRDYLGSADPKKIEAQHYASIAGLTSATLKSVTSDDGHKFNVKATAPPKETLFLCPANHAACTQNGKPTGVLAAAYAARQAVIFCPIFFGGVSLDGPDAKDPYIAPSWSIVQGSAQYLSGGQAHYTGAFNVLHEMQHLPSVVGEHTLEDLWIKTGAPNEVVPRPLNHISDHAAIKGVYYREDCKGLPIDKKAKNTQNIAYYALDVYSDPARAKSSVASKVAAIGAKIGAKIGSKTPKRFEAIYQRQADKEATAEPGACDTNPGSTTGRE